MRADAPPRIPPARRSAFLLASAVTLARIDVQHEHPLLARVNAEGYSMSEVGRLLEALAEIFQVGNVGIGVDRAVAETDLLQILVVVLIAKMSDALRLKAEWVTKHQYSGADRTELRCIESQAGITGNNIDRAGRRDK